MKYLYFSASWCGPCQNLKPVMEQVNQTIPVTKIDVDMDAQTVSDYGVRSIPTVVLIKDGREVKRFTGVQPLNTYLNPL
jgi:thioredoxin 1